VAVKRSIYLIDPKFQLKFSFFVCSLVFISSLVYPITIYEILDALMVKASTPEAVDELNDKRRMLILTLSIYQLGFTGIVFIICIFQSHKIAGPIYKLRKFLANVIDGNPAEKLFFRKGDNFQEVADDFNLVFEKIQENHNEDFAYLSEINSYINNLALVVPDDKKPVLMEISAKLTEIQDRFKAR